MVTGLLRSRRLAKLGYDLRFDRCRLRAVDRNDEHVALDIAIDSNREGIRVSKTEVDVTKGNRGISTGSDIAWRKSMSMTLDDLHPREESGVVQRGRRLAHPASPVGNELAVIADGGASITLILREGPDSTVERKRGAGLDRGAPQPIQGQL